jgi:hypothetical protein
MDDSDEGQAYEKVARNEPGLSDELLGAATSYAAMNTYDEHCQRKGKVPISVIKATRITSAGPPDSYEKAKELIYGFASAFLDREIETIGLEHIDKAKADQEAKKHINKVVAEDDY